MGKLTAPAARLRAPAPRLAAPPKVADPFYQSPAWRALVAKIKRERGARCEEPGCGATGVRLIGDHVKELRDGGAPLDARNVLLRCLPCHNTKTAAERARRALRR
jgi:hypothetical protein